MKNHSDRIKIWIVDARDEATLEELGTCLTDSPRRALEMYQADCEKWDDKGYMPELRWRWCDAAAVSLGSRGGKSRSDAKQSAARENGKRGGRPRKDQDVAQG